MLKYIKLIIPIFVLATISISCINKKNNEKNITVSILPQKYLVERICGDQYKLNVLIPPGANPATCELTSKQIQTLLNSKLYFSIGYLPYETNHIKNVLEENKELKQISLSENIDLIREMIQHGDHHHEGGVDPHIWTSPKNVKVMCKNILNHLSTTYPKDANLFSKNYENFLKDIDKLDLKIKKALESKTNRNFMIYHPTLTYFAKDYSLKQIPIEYEGKSPSPKYIKDIIEIAKATDTKIVFVQKQFDTKKAEFIAKEINGKVIPIDPLNENWLKEMYSIFDILDKNLE